MASGAIPNASISASSFLTHTDGDRVPQNARLGVSNEFWSNNGDDNSPWIQADLGSSHRVSGLQIVGNGRTDMWRYWVQQLKVEVGFSESDLAFIKDDNDQDKVCLSIFFAGKHLYKRFSVFRYIY